MISVVIATLNHERQLGPLLGALVPAVVDGLVRQAIVVDGGSTDATLEIARDAGADVLELAGPVEARLKAGCARAKGEWLMILDPAAVPPPGWEAAARAHIERRPGEAAWFAPPSGWRLRWPKARGLLAPRGLVERAGGHEARRWLLRKARRLRIA